MTILIIDDEALLVQNLHSILSNSSLKIEQIHLAQNVDAAIEIINSDHPDVVLSDIRMPNKSGIDLAKYMHENFPHTPVILITGYSDFEYTQASIQNQVFDYILKPVEGEKVIAAVSSAYRQLEAYQQHEHFYDVFRDYFDSNLEFIKKQYIEDLLFRRISTPMLDSQRELFNLDFNLYRLVAIQCNSSMKNNPLEGEYYCTSLVEQYIKKNFPNAITHVFGNIVFYIWEVQNSNTFSDSTRLTNILSDIFHYAKQNLFGSLAIGVSQESDTLAHIHHMRKQSTECLDYIFHGNHGNILFYEDIVETASLQYDVEDDLQALLSAVRSGSKDSSIRCFQGIVRQASQISNDYLTNSFLLIVSNLSFLLHELKLEGEPELSVTHTVVPLFDGADIEKHTALLCTWIKKICQRISSEYQQRSNKIIDSIKEFINQNYGQCIGLAEAAQYVGRNSSYVSRLVKELTGKSFTQMITDKRLYEAKQLLKNTSLKIGDIALKTGYPNARYFNRVFKTNVNMSANDYRKFESMREAF